MRWLVVAVMLFAATLAAESDKLNSGERILAKMGKCKDAKCRAKTLESFEQDTALRVRTLLVQEEALNLERGADASKECLKKFTPGKEQDACLYHVREVELRRKSEIMIRLIRDQNTHAVAGCKMIKDKKEVEACLTLAKHQLAAEETRTEDEMVDILRSYNLTTTKDEAEFAHLPRLAEKCDTLQCQRDVISKHCPKEGLKRRICTRMILQVPLAYHDKNSYLESLREQVRKCKDEACRRKVFDEFHHGTDVQIRTLARLSIVVDLDKAKKGYEKCKGDEACNNLVEEKALTDALKDSEKIAKMNHYLQVRFCAKVKDLTDRRNCLFMAKRDANREKDQEKDKIQAQLKALEKKYGKKKDEKKKGDEKKDEKKADGTKKDDPKKADSEKEAVVEKFAEKLIAEKKQVSQKEAVVEKFAELLLKEQENAGKTETKPRKEEEKKAHVLSKEDLADVEKFVATLHQKDKIGMVAWSKSHQGSHAHEDSVPVHRRDSACSREDVQAFAAEMREASEGLAKASRLCKSDECMEHYVEAINQIAADLKRRAAMCHKNPKRLA